jgi:hypothetical protein
VHGIRDNVPPFAFDKVVVQPYNDISQTSQEQSFKFKIPQQGTLNRAYLRIRTKNYVPTHNHIYEGDGTHPDSIWDNTLITTANTNDSGYDALKSKMRLPWTHPSAAQTAPTRVQVLGSGGSTFIKQESVIAGDTGDALGDSTTELGSNFSLYDPKQFNGSASNAWNVINVLESMTLSSNGKEIERVYGETIPAEVVKMAPDLRDFYVKGMVGYAAGDKDGALRTPAPYHQTWDPSMCLRDVYGRLAHSNNTSATQPGILVTGDGQHQLMRNNHVDFIVPVTLSSLKSLPKNYQTRFVQNLELEVNMKELGRGFNATTANSETTKYHEVELVLIFHNWHDNIENSIRNANFKRGVPASVYSTNWQLATSRAKWVDGSSLLDMKLLSRNLVTELLIVGRMLSIGDVGGVDSLKKLKSDYTFLTTEKEYDVDLLGSGMTLWSASSLELKGPDTADYDLTDRQLRGGDAAYGGLMPKNRALGEVEGRKPWSYRKSLKYKISGEDYSQTGIEYGFGNNMTVIRFGFQTTDEFYAGGIALKTISNPTLRITPRFPSEWDGKEIEFNVYVKHASMVRIDSDIGAITRTLDV